MGDPFAIAARVTDLISLGLQSAEYLYQFYTAYRDRDADLARIADRLADLLRTSRLSIMWYARFDGDMVKQRSFGILRSL